MRAARMKSQLSETNVRALKEFILLKILYHFPQEDYFGHNFGASEEYELTSATSF